MRVTIAARFVAKEANVATLMRVFTVNYDSWFMVEKRFGGFNALVEQVAIRVR